MSPPGSTLASTETYYQKTEHSYTLKGYGALTRRASAGNVADFGLSLHFSDSKAKEQPDVDVAFLFSLMDQSSAGFQILRNATNNPVATIRFIEFRRGEDQETVLREFPLVSGELIGNWQLRYQHGMLSIRHRTKELGCASIQRIGIPISGVTWFQRGGKVSCDHMTLLGQPFQEYAPGDKETRTRAAKLNQEARQFLSQQNYTEALSRMSNASALYVQVHGENHHDSANSFVNLASILSKSGQPKPATQLFTKALTIHEAILGLNHPHTTMTRFSLGELCFSQGDIATAAKHWTRCRDDWRLVFGPEYSLVKSLDSTLQRLLPMPSK